ncbi:MAG: GntR family transcriptional regulator [Lachnospiraceae bacterium]|nr:GntR family transcriptional regulator [Lachnospiraceae bacterium]
MMIQIDFNSEEALYMQLRNQIILGIATAQYREGDALPSVRALADTVGINMHTVNKAYSVLRQDGFVKVDRRRGAVIAVDIDALRARAGVEKELRLLLAKALCQGIERKELHSLLDDICDEYEKVRGK